MKIQETGKSLITSFLFLIFGALIFAYPDQVIITTSMAFGGILIFYGMILIIKNYYETKQNSNNSSATLMLGIFVLVAGILFVVLAGLISQILQFVLGAWLLFTGIERLMIAISLGKNNNSFITQIIIGTLLILAGLYTIFKAHLEIQIIGIIMIIYSILQIIGYFSNKKEVTEKKEDVKIEKIETKEDKDDNIKEAKIVEEKTKKEK